MHGLHDTPRTPTTAGTTRRAFTIIELLVVMAIIGILVLLLMPNSRLARDRTDEAVHKHEDHARQTNDALRGDFEDNRRLGE